MAEYSPAVLNGVLPYKTIFKRFVSHRRALALFDRITVSTTALARHAKKIFLGTKFAIIPNSVHHSWFGMRGFQERHRVPTITYFPGTRSHDRDFALVIEPLNRILASHPATQLFISGPLAVSIRARRGQVIHQQKVGFSKFHLLFKSGAINLAPLEATPFNQCKSALKLIEAGWWGIPTICSPTPDVRRFLDKDELTANNAAEWHDRLERLLLDRSYYAAVASNLRELVIKRADVHANAERN